MRAGALGCRLRASGKVFQMSSSKLKTVMIGDSLFSLFSSSSIHVLGSYDYCYGVYGDLLYNKSIRILKIMI